MPLDACEGASRINTIRIPGLSDFGVGLTEVPDRGEDTQAIYDHIQGISPGHPLLAVQELTRPVA